MFSEKRLAVSLSKDGLYLIETDMSTDKSHFHYGRKDDEFTELVSRT